MLPLPAKFASLLYVPRTSSSRRSSALQEAAAAARPRVEVSDAMAAVIGPSVASQPNLGAAMRLIAAKKGAVVP